MIASDAHVEYDVHGKIDGALSYVTVIDQTPGWSEGSNEAGDVYQYEKNVDAKWNFNTLFERYVPFTYKEWLGEDPIEKTECTLSHKGETITKEQLFDSVITCNYGIADAYLSDAFFLEIVRRGTDKADALVRLLDHLGLTHDNLIAAGDGHNDMGMIRLASIGIAMGNAHPDVRKVADIVAPDASADGLAQVLERLLEE